jgi:hypothetical protein
LFIECFLEFVGNRSGCFRGNESAKKRQRQTGCSEIGIVVAIGVVVVVVVAVVVVVVVVGFLVSLSFTV